MRQRLFFATSISFFASLLLVIFPTAAQPIVFVQPSSPPPLATLTHTIYLPLVFSSPTPKCFSPIKELVLSGEDIPADFVLNINQSGIVNLTDEEITIFGDAIGCNVYYDYRAAAAFTTTVIMNVVMLFQDTTKAGVYYQNVLTSPSITYTQSVDMPSSLGDQRFGRKFTSKTFSAHYVAFRKDTVFVSVTVIGITGMVPFTDAIKYARIVEAKRSTPASVGETYLETKHALR